MKYSKKKVKRQITHGEKLFLNQTSNKRQVYGIASQNATVRNFCAKSTKRQPSVWKKKITMPLSCRGLYRIYKEFLQPTATIKSSSMDKDLEQTFFQRGNRKT